MSISDAACHFVRTSTAKGSVTPSIEDSRGSRRTDGSAELTSALRRDVYRNRSGLFVARRETPDQLVRFRGVGPM